MFGSVKCGGGTKLIKVTLSKPGLDLTHVTKRGECVEPVEAGEDADDLEGDPVEPRALSELD